MSLGDALDLCIRELEKGNKEKAWELFEKSYKLYSLFWGLNLSKENNITANNSSKVDFIDEKGKKKDSESVFTKLGTLVQKAIDCCKE